LRHVAIETGKELYDRGFPYLELTELGKMELYGIIVENINF
jgi:hypothetical protein